VACSDGDALHTNELRRRLPLFLDLETQLDGLADPLDQLVEGARLSMATGQLRDAGHIVTVPIDLDDHTKLTLTDSLQQKCVAENPLGRNQPPTGNVDRGRPATQSSGFASRFDRQVV
jgi:hypothetical protein